MTRRVLFLLVAALLLRGWMGAALAGEMAAQELRLPVAQATAQQGHDCAQAMVEEADADAADASASAHCQGCTLHALPAAPLVLAAALPQASPAKSRPDFASAERLQGDKPPISRVSRP